MHLQYIHFLILWLQYFCNFLTSAQPALQFCRALSRGSWQPQPKDKRKGNNEIDDSLNRKSKLQKKHIDMPFQLVPDKLMNFFWVPLCPLQMSHILSCRLIFAIFVESFAFHHANDECSYASFETCSKKLKMCTGRWANVQSCFM